MPQMADGRSQRKSNLVQFVSKLEQDRKLNLDSLIRKAKQLDLEGFNKDEWDQSLWTITGGRLLKLSGKNTRKVTINFDHSLKLGGGPLKGEWAEFAKTIFILRFHRSQQSAPNQRNFITMLGYVAYEMDSRNLPIYKLTPEYLSLACEKISKDFSDGVAYNMHKAIAELAAHCDANGLCNVMLDYKYSQMKRPLNTGGLGHKRLDDPVTLLTDNEKIVDPIVFKIIGELYIDVPKDHKYRFYVLVLSVLALLGRRFSEVSLMPNQTINRDEDGRAYLNYFPRKQTTGDVLTPIKKLYIPSETLPILEPIIVEIEKLCRNARYTACEIQINNGPDLNRFFDISEEKKLYKEDLRLLGLSDTILDINGWIRKNNYAMVDSEKPPTHDVKGGKPKWYTNKQGVLAYCHRDFHPNLVKTIHIDQQGNHYYLKDMLLVRHVGLSSGFYAHWVASQCTHSMMTTFLRYFPALAKEYASSSIDVNFSSHHFRHTLNTLLDEGGLSDLLQTEWFGRSNPNDTKAYQHTSREKRALMLRADIKAGKIGGRLADKVKNLPITFQDAVLTARIQAVHDVGPGICTHNFIQSACERHLQCSAECDDYVWVKDDKGRAEELKRIYAITVVNRRTAEDKSKSTKPKKSADWIVHNDKKLETLSKQLADNGIADFDVEQYLKEKKIGK